MVSENACQQPTDVKYWPAVEKKGAINLLYLTNTEVKSNVKQNIFINSLLCEAIFLFLKIKLYIIKNRFTFKADEKLKSRKLIQQLFKEGKSFSLFPLRVLYIEPKENISNLQVGFTVSSKNFKKAVDRNRIKRVMREAYRSQKNELQNELEITKNYLAIFIIYTEKSLPEFEVIFEKMKFALQRLEKIISQTNSNI